MIHAFEGHMQHTKKLLIPTIVLLSQIIEHTESIMFEVLESNLGANEKPRLLILA